MAQYDFGTINPDTTSGTALASLLGNFRNALNSNHVGSSRPSYVTAGMYWIDNSGTYWKINLYDGTSDIIQGYYDVTNHFFFSIQGGGAATLGSATVTDLWSVPQSYITITGNATINQLVNTSGLVPGTKKDVVFTGTPILTHNATSLILPGAADISVAAGDRMVVLFLTGSNVAVVSYTRANGKAVVETQETTGKVDDFLTAAAPSKWVDAYGTVGDASSNATQRANADTSDLFAVLWALSASVAPIYTSAGAGSTRGANAAADFAAHKQIAIPDLRGVFRRGLDLSRGLDSGRVLGSFQSDSIISHNHSGSADTQGYHAHSGATTGAGNHTHSISLGLGGRFGANHYAAGSDNPAWASGDSTWGSGTATFGTSNPGDHVHGIYGDGSHSHNITVGYTGGGETRPINVAVRTCIKL